MLFYTKWIYLFGVETGSGNSGKSYMIPEDVTSLWTFNYFSYYHDRHENCVHQIFASNRFNIEVISPGYNKFNTNHPKTNDKYVSKRQLL